MIKVVIADDEIRVCQLISRLIQWEQLDMECVAIVHDGISALEAIDEYEPEIVITDIRMPGYDGLELIQRAKEKNNSIKFIIISGYSNFEYTQNAIRYEASDYILKPIKKEELNKTLQKVKKSVLEEQGQQDLSKITTKQAAMRLSFIRENLLLDGWRQTLNQQQFIQHFTGHLYSRIFAIQMDGYFSQSRQLQVKQWVENIFEMMDSSNDYELVLVGSKQTLVGWVGMNQTGVNHINRDLKYVITQIINRFELKENERISLAAGIIVREDKSIESAFETCFQQLYRRWFVLNSNCFVEALETVSDNYHLHSLLETNLRRLDSAIDELQLSSLDMIFDEIKEGIVNLDYIQGYDFYLWLKSFTLLMQASFLPFRNIVFEAGEFSEQTMTEIEQCPTYKDAFIILQRNATNMVKAILAGKKTIESKPIRQAKRYIEMHYQHEITLESISQEFGLSGAYFSMLFKRETGQKFIEYLTETRIEKSKDLLRDSSLSIAEICHEIGYSDQKHFTAQFKKLTGLKPSEYRKIYA